ncbi:MAG: CHAT domain-containing protein, partial [Chloroflexi bacterium]|nr:CHAT domain-containing protein [Chloroflexota bacterium]
MPDRYHDLPDPFQVLDVDIGTGRVSLQVEDRPYRDIGALDQQQIRDQLFQLREYGNPKDYGKLLMKAAFPPDVLEGFHAAERLAQNQGKYLRLRLNIDVDSPELHALWWECLYDEHPDQSLACARSISLSRYLAERVRQVEPVREEKLKILVAISNPDDLGQPGGPWERFPKLSDEEEEGQRQAILTALSASDLADRVEYDILPRPASFENIQARLATDQYHILHIVGHGAFNGNKGCLLLEDQRRHAVVVDEEYMGILVENLTRLQLVMLVACDSARRSPSHAFVGLAPHMVQSGVPAVVAMQGKISVATAQEFSTRFYGALTKSAQGIVGMVDSAMNFARHSIRQPKFGSWEWAIPVL